MPPSQSSGSQGNSKSNNISTQRAKERRRVKIKTRKAVLIKKVAILRNLYQDSLPLYLFTTNTKNTY
jgi:hypothetical protein